MKIMNKTRKTNKKSKAPGNKKDKTKGNKKRTTLKKGGYEEIKIHGIVVPNIIEPERNDLENIYLSLSKKHHGMGIRDSVNEVDTMFALLKLNFAKKEIPKDQVYEFTKTITHNRR
jgi:TRAP-type uncharacterized transport system substrate-binding protein